METIGGDLTILYYTLEDFKGLSSLKAIEGEIIIRFGLSLINFEGLSALESVGGFVIEENSAENFVGLNSLKRINGSILSQGTDGGIGSFVGLENVEEITGSIALAFNSNFAGWKGLQNLQRVGGDINMEQYSFENFEGLEKLEEIGGELYLYRNGVKSLQGLESLGSVGKIFIESEPLISLDGLEPLRRVNGDFSLIATQVTDITAIQDIESIAEDLRFEFNGQLSECCIIPSLLERVEGEIILRDNGEGCSSLEAIEENCEEETASEENTRISDGILVYPNPSVNYLKVRTDQPTTVQLYNTTGYLVQQQHIDGEGTLDVSKMAAGVYLLKAAGEPVRRIVIE